MKIYPLKFEFISVIRRRSRLRLVNAAASSRRVPRRRFRSVWLVLAGLCLAGGVVVLLPGVMPLLRSTENFQSFKHDARVRYEPGAEAAAAVVARALPEAI